MLISFQHLIKKYRLNITGFIQAGAHFAEELEDFRSVCEDTSKIHLFEPLPDAFEIINEKIRNECAYKIALGAKDGEAILHVDKENTGQSSSILEPELHLQQYPGITFPTKIKVKVKTLDSYKIKGCNALWMDVQGYELEVLKGAVKTLESIDYVYTEVNVDEVYKDCVRLYDLDNFLSQFGFERVELDLSGKTWGDALYIKKKLITDNKYLDIPNAFRQKMPFSYPPDNDYIFEEWFGDGVGNDDFDKFNSYTYLPIFWTGYYCGNSFGKNEKAIAELQKFLDALSNKEKYYTICQYDDGILNDFRDKDVTVFSMGGGGAIGRNVKIVPIPLLGQQHKFDYTGVKKDVMCNFIGKIETHPVRKKMQDFIYGKPDFFVHFNKPIDNFCLTVARSFFTLAPRGYGKTSFRIWEALQYKSVPIYVTEDEPFLPEFYDHHNKPCMIICKPIEIADKMYKLFGNRELYNQYIENGDYYYSQFFNYNGLAQYILDYLFLTKNN